MKGMLPKIASVVGTIVLGVLANFVYGLSLYWLIGAILALALGYLFVRAGVLIFRLGIVGGALVWGSSHSAEMRTIRATNSRVRFLTATGRTAVYSSQIEAAIVTRAAERSCSFRFLLMNPHSSALAEFCSSEGADVVLTQGKIRDTTQALLRLREKHNLDLEVRWFEERPSWRMVVADSARMELGCFAPARKGYEGYRLSLRDHGTDSLIHPFVAHFDYMWERSTPADGSAGPSAALSSVASYPNQRTALSRQSAEVAPDPVTQAVVESGPDAVG